MKYLEMAMFIDSCTFSLILLRTAYISFIMIDCWDGKDLQAFLTFLAKLRSSF